MAGVVLIIDISVYGCVGECVTQTARCSPLLSRLARQRLYKQFDSPAGVAARAGHSCETARFRLTVTGDENLLARATRKIDASHDHSYQTER